MSKDSDNDFSNEQVIKDSNESLKGYSGKRIVLYCVKCGGKAIDVEPTKSALQIYRRKEMKENCVCLLCRGRTMTLKQYLIKKGIKPWW